MATSQRKTSSRKTGSRPSRGRDYVAIAEGYAREAIADRSGKKFGRLIKLAARRFIDDLRRAKGKRAPFKFDEWEAHNACDFIEKLPHVEGVWETPNIVLHPSHVFFVVQLFGFRKADKTRRFTSALFAVARKNAKALALDTPVPTPSGWSTMGDLAPGDVVFGADGKPCSVTAVSPVYVDHECYRLKFSNGEEVVADAGHSWLTSARIDQPNGARTSNGATRTRVRTTEEIAATLKCGARGDTNHSILMPKPLQCAVASLPISPYTLGAWLGDGHSAAARITCDRDDIEIIDGIRADGWPVREKYCNGSKASTFVISDGDRTQSARNKSLAAQLRATGVLGNKGIPAIYLRASREQRLALLQGLMDTDGTISKSGRVLSFTSTSEQLTRGVAELLASFGLKYSWRRERLVCNGIEVSGTGHKLQFMAFRDQLPVFRLRRKLDRMLDQAGTPRSRTVQIVAADRVPPVPVKCITVDAPDSLFLFGKSMLLTHNSTLAAAIMLYCMCCEDEPGAQLVSAATTGSQARIIWNVAKRMAEKKSALREAFGLECWANAITRLETGAGFKPINAKASTQDGLNPSHTALDEIHAHKSGDLLNVLQSAAGARSSPLWLFTTTEGYETPGPWPELRHFARQVLEGVLGVTADHFLALFFAVDDEDEDFDETAWIKANPLADANPHLLAAIRKEAIEARAMPGKLAEFRIKRLNRQSSNAKSLIDIRKWNRCDGAINLDWLAQYPCWAGLDLSSTTDMTAWRLVWRVDGKWYTWGRRWVPEEAVRHRTQRGANTYAAWVEGGHVSQTGGDTVDYAVIEQAIREDVARFSPQSIAFDDWNAKDLSNRLLEDGLPLVRFIQGPKSYHPAMQEVDRAYRSGDLVHGGDPVLRWCASNLIPRYDANMNMAPDKRRSPDKIDDMAALYMAVGVALSVLPEGDIDGFLSNPVTGR
jgi:phage terminase large subunit-like protein